MDSNGSNCIDVPGSGINGSESVVSTILWDFFDTRNVGSDTLHYVNPYYITNMYLSNNPTTAQQLHGRIHSDCITGSNSEATNNGTICKGIFAQNGGSDLHRFLNDSGPTKNRHKRTLFNMSTLHLGELFLSRKGNSPRLSHLFKKA